MSEDNDKEVLIKPPGIVEGSEIDQEITEMLTKKALAEKNQKIDFGQPAYRRYYPKPPLAYVSNFYDNTVSVVEIRTGLKVMDIPVGNGPYGIDISPDQKFVYVANVLEATLSVICTRHNRVVNTIYLNTPHFLAEDPAGVKVSPNGRLVYVANSYTDNISVVDTYLQQVVTEVPLSAGTSPYVLDITADGRLAYVTLLLADKVAVVDLKVNLPIKYIDIGNFPTGIAIAERKSLALAANQFSDSLSAMNTIIAETSPNTIAVGRTPSDIVFYFCGYIAYVSNWRDNNVGIVNVFSHQQIDNIPLDNHPFRLALTADGRLLVVSIPFNDTVSIIDTMIRKVIATVPVGDYPSFIAIMN